MMQILTIALHAISSISDFLFTTDPIERRLRDGVADIEYMKVMQRSR